MRKKKKNLLIFVSAMAVVLGTNGIVAGADSKTLSEVNRSFVKVGESIDENANSISADSITDMIDSNYVYLSDISYDEDKSFVAGGHSIHLDQNENNEMITLKINDKNTSFIKGMCAWATSEIIYDLGGSDYDYFTSYLGVDISEQNTYFNTGVKFYVYTSDDGVNWDEKFQSETLYGWSEAQFAKVDIKDAKYLKLTADDNSDSWWSSWYDEAVYANAKLIKDDYTEDTSTVDFIKTVDEYDEIIKENYGQEISGDYELNLLQREFVSNAGYETLQALAKYKNEYKDTINWLMSDKETLRLYLVGGKPEGSYLNSIKVLADLYNAHKDDLANENVTEYGTKYCDLYRTMILALSLTESGNVYFWLDGTQKSDANTRYEIYKNLHLHEGQESELIENRIFESLTVEEMRWVMNTIIDDEEIVWLNDYVRNEGKGAISPYNYIRYTSGYNYELDKYYSEENYNEWDEKYHLSEYNITYKKGNPKQWIVFEEGSVCGGLSKTGSSIWGTYKGLPNTCVSQPAHCAYVYYTQDSDGNGIWNLGNDVSGWGKSGRTEHLNIRTMNDWGNGSYTSGWNANYILLAQAAQNEYEVYEKAEEIMMLAKVYNNDSEKREEIYRQVIDEEEINFDAWLGLIKLYESDENKTQEDYYKLAEAIAETYKYYPNPMYDLLNLIKPHLTSVEYDAMFTLLQTRTLTTAANATNNDSIQATAVRQVANNLLGNVDTTIATFSFDGENAGCILISDRYNGTDVAWEYSFDGGNTWKLTEEHSVKLTDEELAEITSENDIKIHIMGVDYSDENIFTIDIKESAGLPTNIYANDLENKLIGVTDTVEWKYEENEKWTSYSEAEPDLTGNKTLIVRAGATGIYLPESTSTTYQFTQDNFTDAQKYISLNRLSIYSVSSEQSGNGDYAKNAIDGNINTLWHTAYNGSDTDRTIIIKVDEPVYLSAFEYVPRQIGTNGRTRKATLYVSMDGEEWTEVASVTDWANSAEWKTIELQESIKAQYIKFVTTQNWGDGRSFASAAMINLYEEIIKEPESTTEEETTTTPESTTEEETTTAPESTTEIETTTAPESTTKTETITEPEITTKLEENITESEIQTTTENTIKHTESETGIKETTTDTTKKNDTELTNSTTTSNVEETGNNMVVPKAKIKSVKTGKKKVSIKIKKIAFVKGYKVQFSTNKKFKGKKTKYTTKTKVILKKLKSNKTYYFRIKAYVIGNDNKKVYSKKWSKVVKKIVK